MPRMTSAELALATRQLRPELPILLATSYADMPSNADIGLPRLSKPH